MRSLSACLALTALTACSPASSQPPADASAKPPAAIAAPSVPACAADAYRHAGPAFCINVPAELRGRAPDVLPDGVLFHGEHQTLSITWVPRSDKQRVDAWRALEPTADRIGTFEVIATEPLPGGTFAIIHDATQSRTTEIYRVPSLSGVAVIEDDTRAFRCAAVINLERGGENGRSIAEQKRDFLRACRSFHPG